jgi:ABC-type spermidine/putrescine transport system permease subunit II
VARPQPVSGVPEIDPRDCPRAADKKASAVNDPAGLSGGIHVAELRHDVATRRWGTNLEFSTDRPSKVKWFACCVRSERKDIVPNLSEPFVRPPEPPLYRLAFQAWHEVPGVMTPPGLHRDAVRPRPKRASLWAAVRLPGVPKIQTKRLGTSRRPAPGGLLANVGQHPGHWRSVLDVVGYILAFVGHLRIPGYRLLLLLFIFGLTLPFEAVITPIYYIVRSLGILNTRLAIIVPLIGLYMPFAVFWMRAHFVNMPRELSEAARVDGAGLWVLFWRVHVPLAKPAIVSLGILMSVWTWNQFILALILVDDPKQRTVAGALGAFQGQWGTDIPLLSAGSILILLPSLIVFVIFQRQVITALLQGSVKG